MKTILKVAACAVFLVYLVLTILLMSHHYAMGADFPAWAVFLWPLALLGIALGL